MTMALRKSMRVAPNVTRQVAASAPLAAIACAVAVVLAGCSRPADPALPASAATASAAPEAVLAPSAASGVSVASVASAQPLPTRDHAEQDAHGIAWRQASSDADVDAAFAQARTEGKPLFLYWGAKWCPPCNQVKATLFNRQDFIERSRAFVPVYVDGDSPGAQKLGARFKVSGYPTMLLFSPQGAELTRLPGEVEAERYTQVLTLGMNAQRPVKEVLAQALAASDSPKASSGKVSAGALTANDWKLLAFYSWDTDQAQLVPEADTPAVLKKLADAVPRDPPETATRLRLKALAAVDGKAPLQPNAAAQAMLIAGLADPAASRAQLEMLTNYAPEITRALSARGTPQRAELLAAFESGLKRFEADASLSRADRITALIARVDLARIDLPKDSKTVPPLPPQLLADVREHAARDDREITNGYERQAVITSAAYLLREAGLADESDALLQANLAKSHSPYYLMSQLATNAKKRGDTAGALRWSQEAFEKSEGPATRLQWGASYVGTLLELAPKDEARIEQAARQLITEAAAQPDAFYERSGRSLSRTMKKLQAWNQGGVHAAAMARLQTQLGGVCKAIAAGDPQKASCEALGKPAAESRAS
ncbi:thioredoxin family protein [soil metagenome]